MVEIITVLVFTWIAMAVLTAWLVEILKKIFPWIDFNFPVAISGKVLIFYVERILALAIAAVLSWSVSLDFFVLLGIDSRIAGLGWIISFIVVSQGSSGFHDLWGRIKIAFNKFMEEFGEQRDGQA